jgi:ABC-2 type transport system ATP-binding protein
MVGLADRATDPLRSYSKGMQQRAGLAQALLNDPSLVFLDEPTSALDPLGRLDVRGIIRALRNAGTTVFLNSHLLSEVEMVCDRVAIVNRGQVAAIGPVDALLRRDLVVELTIGEWNDAIERRLERRGVVRDARPGGAGRTTILLEVDGDASIAAAVDDLVHEGVAVYEVSPRSRSLEELFFEVVSGDKRQRDR